MSGILYLVATPIGNMEDMTFRAVRILKEVDLIAAEDTRTSAPLLAHYEINTPLTSYHEFNKLDKADTLVGKLLSGANIAAITDAGTPGISDPGEELVKKCYEAGIRVEAVPGPAAVIAAVTSSGQECRRFAFEAFLPREKRERQRIIEELKSETRTIVLYESPHHLTVTIKDLAQALGEERELTICRELTKKFEEKIILTLGEAIKYYEENSPRGEYVLCIAGKTKEQVQQERIEQWDGISTTEHVEYYVNQGKDRKEAMKMAAKDLGVSKSEIYKRLLEEQDENGTAE